MRETAGHIGLTFFGVVWFASTYHLVLIWQSWESAGITKDCLSRLLSGQIDPASTRFIAGTSAIAVSPFLIGPLFLAWRHIRRDN